MYKLGKTRVIANAPSRLPGSIKTIGVCNQTTYASLFYIEPEWLNDVKEFLKTWQIEGTLSIQQMERLVKKT